MGSGCSSSGGDGQKSNSKKIDKTLKQDFAQMNDQLKLLLLGAGQSGKSTIFKQMKILHQNGFSQDELAAQKQSVHNNILTAITILINQAEIFQFDLSELESEIALIRGIVPGEPIDVTMITPIKKVWRSQPIQDAYARNAEYQLADSASYFLNGLERALQPGYIPTEKDVLHIRIKTTGIVETSWDISGATFRMFDVGGQRNERRKWIHCFDNVTAVIFVAAISEYDQILEEDSKKNRLEEAIGLFDHICNSKHFLSTAMILFLNKIDLFKEKLPKISLQKCFPDYQGGADFESAADFIQSQFINLSLEEDRQIYVHLTCATDTENIRFVFNAVKDIILSKSLKQSGFA
eukprot:c12547_g1_i1.p1 GENE.c12547_g1_i1~~c12547_g1_i1.p1  ORF type:complete len:350 (+),score=91.43 c12547_g1_i1:37-1086(+)